MKHDSKKVKRFGAASRHGFTLLETIIALVLVVSAMVGPFSLATRGIFGAKFNKSKLVALNLAQEGIEIIRGFRDTNVIKGHPWRGDPSCTPDCIELPDSSLGTTYQPDVFSDSLLEGSLPLRIDPTTNLYYQNASIGAETPFTRTVVLSTPTADQMKIVSTVVWTESGLSRQVKLEEVLYNWQ